MIIDQDRKPNTVMPLHVISNTFDLKNYVIINMIVPSMSIGICKGNDNIAPRRDQLRVNWETNRH